MFIKYTETVLSYEINTKTNIISKEKVYKTLFNICRNSAHKEEACNSPLQRCRRHKTAFQRVQYEDGDKRGVIPQWRNLTSTISSRWSKSISSHKSYWWHIYHHIDDTVRMALVSLCPSSQKLIAPALSWEIHRTNCNQGKVNKIPNQYSHLQKIRMYMPSSLKKLINKKKVWKIVTNRKNPRIPDK